MQPVCDGALQVTHCALRKLHNAEKRATAAECITHHGVMAFHSRWKTATKAATRLWPCAPGVGCDR